MLNSTRGFQGNADPTAVSGPSCPRVQLSPKTDGSVCLDVEAQTSHPALAGRRLLAPRKMTRGVTVGPSSSAPRCLHRRSGTSVRTELCPQMFTAAGLLVAETRHSAGVQLQEDRGTGRGPPTRWSITQPLIGMEPRLWPNPYEP